MGGIADKRPKRGRPRTGDRPPIPWGEIEKTYVCGETVRQRHDGSFERSYPSIRDLAKKFGVHRSLVGYHSRRHNWPARRQDFQSQLRTEIQQIRAKARALSIQDVIGILDAYLERFRVAVESGHVRVDSITDLNTAVRLKRFLLSEAESRTAGVSDGMTLDQLRAVFLAADRVRATSHASLPAPDAGARAAELPLLAKSGSSSPSTDENPRD